MANANTTNNNNMATTNTNVMGANAGNLNGNANPVKQTAAATKDSLQEERELQDMLDRLDQAHLQLRALRMTLPRMLDSLKTQHSSPQEAYEAFIQAVETTNKDIASFQATILALHAEGIFTKAFTSRKENPLGLKQWRPTEHPDWADADRKRKRTS
ncbi:hypothetical protein VTJ04DRAFT_205 [Mycothermus thermophilus]|uniref:uncharacterized protein n=1 Tax=Humicola insolens TaxID=85995 RepID=UPI0037434361